MNILHLNKTALVSLHGLDDSGKDAVIPSDVTAVFSSTDTSVFTVAPGSGLTAVVTPVGTAGATASVHVDAKYGDGRPFPVDDSQIALAAAPATHATIDFVEQ